jgi:hypothetical protein
MRPSSAGRQTQRTWPSASRARSSKCFSPSTRSFDRFRKLLEYPTIDTLAYILLVDTEAPRIDVSVRGSDGRWRLQGHEGIDARIDLPAIGATLALADVFEGLIFEPSTSP